MMPRAIEYREYNPSDIGYVRDIIEYDLGYSVLPDELEGRINEMLSRNDYKIFVACDGEKDHRSCRFHGIQKKRYRHQAAEFSRKLLQKQQYRLSVTEQRLAEGGRSPFL